MNREIALEAITESVHALQRLAKIDGEQWLITSGAILSLNRLARNLGYEDAFSAAYEHDLEKLYDAMNVPGNGPFP